MNIGIVGQGYVGTAVRVAFEKFYNVYTFDINKNLSNCKSIQELVEKSDIIFICVPTPMNKDGSCNLEVIKSVVENINMLADSNSLKIVAVKSTVLPGTIEQMNQKYKNISIVFNPEFLTEANFIEDFNEQDRIIIGGDLPMSNKLEEIYSTVFPDVVIIKTNSKTAEMVKYFTNTFLATKVAFANEMKIICDSINLEYDEVIEYAKYDKRLGSSHWDVPGPDGNYGFGGSCFPKDINALISFCDENDISLNVLPAIWNLNLKVRPAKDWEELKGRAVVNDRLDKE